MAFFKKIEDWKLQICQACRFNNNRQNWQCPSYDCILFYLNEDLTPRDPSHMLQWFDGANTVNGA